LKKIGVSSPDPSVGKTSIAVNLALSLAETGLKVLLIDTDLRKPTIYKALDLPISPGFTDLLSGQNILENVVRKVTGYETLDVITSGEIPQNPAELLGSTQMETLVNNYTHLYDYIIFDTPPINMVTDAAVLAKIFDGIVYVVSYGQTLMEAAKLAKKSLEIVDANIIGCVFNNVDVKTNGNSGYYRNCRKKYKGYVGSSKNDINRKIKAS
jgi:capsular exopolysaccharide synthesis family protein